jgi:hypothetical protein
MGSFWLIRTNAGAGGCASPVVHTRKSITTGRQARLKNAPSAIRALRTATPQYVLKPALGVSAIWVSSFMMLTGLKKPPACENEEDLYEAMCDIFLNPHDPEVIAQARRDGIPDNWIEGAQKSPIYKMAIDWKVAFPLHPEYRTLPMVWYIPPLSPVQSAAAQGKIPTRADGIMPDLDDMRIPGQVSGEPAHRRQGSAHSPWAQAHDGDAPLYAEQDVRGES